MPNIYDAELEPVEAGRRARVAEAAGAEHLGASLYELSPGDGMHFHYHLGREELLIVLSGRLWLRTGEGERELAQGEVVAFPRGERGAHGFENRGAEPVRVLVVSEQNAPNVSVYPDENHVGIFDAPHPPDRRFGALFDVADAIEAYGGGTAAIVPPGSGAAGSSTGG
jgi:uncharacterized cupin superfamily protein